MALNGCGLAASDPATASKPLELKLTADKAKVLPGEAIVLTTTIVNPNDVPVNVYLGPSYSGICFVNGSHLEARPEAGGWDREGVMKAAWHIGFCGTCSYKLVVAVPAKGTVQYVATGNLKVGAKGPYFNFGGSPEHDYVTLPLNGEGKFALRVKHNIPTGIYSSASYDSDDRWLPKVHSIEKGYAPDAKAPNWEGTLISNDVTIEVATSRRG
jgi:hypothetical protein